MKKLLSACSSLIFWMALNPVTGWTQQAVGPRMVIWEEYFDAKQVNQGEIVEHTFKVSNTGDRTLEIRRVKPG